MKYKWRNHLLLGKKLGEGKEHLVFTRGKYVYKINWYKSKNIIDIIKHIFKYLRIRNSIPFQVPCKFVGFCFLGGYMFPIFKQLKLEHLTWDIYTFYTEVGKLERDFGRYVRDVKPNNFGLLNGELKAFDVYYEEYNITDATISNEL